MIRRRSDGEGDPPAKRARVFAQQFHRTRGNRVVKSFLYQPETTFSDVLVFNDHVHESVTELLTEQLAFMQMKVVFTLQVLMLLKNAITGEEKKATPFFRSKAIILLNTGDIAPAQKGAGGTIEKGIDRWMSEGSGWVVRKIMKMYVDIAKFDPMQGRSYFPLPGYLAAKGAIVNVKNNDNQCLKWALLSALHPIDHNPHRVTKYQQYADELDFSGVEFPATLCDVDRVEKNNNLQINVFGMEGKKVYPLRIANEPQDAVNLMLLHNDEEVTTHWMWIKNFSRLCSDKTNHDGQRYFCMRCLSGHGSEDILARHMVHCKDHKIVRAVLPKEGEKLRFSNHQKQLKCPYIIYADCEALIEPLEQPIQAGNNTIRDSQHHVCSVAYVVIRSDGTNVKSQLHRGPDAMDLFLMELEELETEIQDDLRAAVPMNLTEAEENQFSGTEKCWICDKPFSADGRDPKVRDHDHITGDFRGAAHQSCNLKLRICPFKQHIPVVFHNLKGYDGHHIVCAIGKTTTDVIVYEDENGKEKTKDQGAIHVIPSNAEKLISISWWQYVFIDSLAFLNASLDKLAQSTPAAAFHHTAEQHPEPIRRDLIRRKGVYPYEYMSSWEKFDDHSLPPREAFYSTLAGAGISEGDYEHAQRVWDVFGCTTMGDYHDLYLQTDVLLLCDIFENFRRTALETYSLDPANYHTLPGFGWDALLKYSDISLDLLSDVDMHQFVEHGMRGGVSMVTRRYAKANNPYIDGFQHEQPTTYLQYLDANNLYGWAMCQYLPTSAFKWETPTDELLEQICAQPDDHSIGYMVECDLLTPESHHDLFSDYPLAPEKLSVKEAMLSPYQQQLAAKLTVTGLECPKLVPNLLAKQRYVVHYRNLKLYKRLGMVITRVHRVLSFKQAPWMRSYIHLNTQLRTNATTDFEKDFFKLMNNCVFGKTMENVRHRVNLRLLRAEDEEAKLLRAINKPTYQRSILYDNNLVGVCIRKTQVKLCKPVYVGMSVLDLSKLLMFEFFYDILKPKYDERVKLLYTDTDSLILEFRTDDLYADMATMLDVYDTSNYPVGHDLHSQVNKKVVGKFKDELGGKVLQEFVGLRSKMYAYEAGDASGMRAKGVKKAVLRDTIVMDDYVQCLHREESISRPMTGLRSHSHHIFGESIVKTALSPFDSKRYILPDGITTIPFGHKDIA